MNEGESESSLPILFFNKIFICIALAFLVCREWNQIQFYFLFVFCFFLPSLLLSLFVSSLLFGLRCCGWSEKERTNVKMKGREHQNEKGIDFFQCCRRRSILLTFSFPNSSSHGYQPTNHQHSVPVKRKCHRKRNATQRRMDGIGRSLHVPEKCAMMWKKGAGELAHINNSEQNVDGCHQWSNDEANQRWRSLPATLAISAFLTRFHSGIHWIRTNGFFWIILFIFKKMAYFGIFSNENKCQSIEKHWWLVYQPAQKAAFWR